MGAPRPGRPGAGLHELTLEELEAQADLYDEAVVRDEEVDPFCTATPWILSFQQSFGRRREPIVVHDGEEAWLCLARHPDYGYLEPLESMWGFASPIVGRGAVGLFARWANETADRMRLERLASKALASGVGAEPGDPDEETGADGPEEDPDTLDPDKSGSGERDEVMSIVLHGFREDDRRVFELLRALGPAWRLRRIHRTARVVASLAGGIDGYLSRRSRKFRRNLRKTQREAAGAGLVFERIQGATPDECDDLYERVMAVERRSWKSRAGMGVDTGNMKRFYGLMFPRLARRGALRVTFLVQGDRDLGYIHGGVVGDRFRGLQFSFDQSMASLGAGNLLQADMLAWMADEGILHYDFGMDVEYKDRWSDGKDWTQTIHAARALRD